MAKDNLFLGTARGSVGDIVFSRMDGQQVARVRNRAPRNPQSPAQMVQRIIMSTVGKAYSMMQELCNHSFEGFETGQLSQRKFMEVNVGILRDKVAEVLAYPVEEVIRSSDAYNFSFKNDYAPVVNSYQISAGSLPSIALVSDDFGWTPAIPLVTGTLTPNTVSYADIAAYLGLQRGDQLTFIQVSHDGSKEDHGLDIITGFRFARVILEPASGDMTVPFIASNQINDPNPRNSGGFNSIFINSVENNWSLHFNLNNIVQSTDTTHPDRQLAGSAVIVSRRSGERWLRSTQFLMPRYTTSGSILKSSTLSLAYETYLTGSASDLYLNQAE